MTFADRQASLNVRALRKFGALHALDGEPVQGDFVEPGKVSTIGEFVQMTARVPTLVVADGDVPSAPVGKFATCNGTTYSVEEALPDGLGLTALELKKAPA